MLADYLRVPKPMARAQADSENFPHRAVKLSSCSQPVFPAYIAALV